MDMADPLQHLEEEREENVIPIIDRPPPQNPNPSRKRVEVQEENDERVNYQVVEEDDVPDLQQGVVMITHPLIRTVQDHDQDLEPQLARIPPLHLRDLRLRVGSAVLGRVHLLFRAAVPGAHRNTPSLSQV